MQTSQRSLEACGQIGTIATSSGDRGFTLTGRTALAEISTGDQHVIRTRALPHSTVVIYSAEGSLWIGALWLPHKGPLVIYRLNPRTADLVHRYTLHTQATFVAVQAGAIWLTDPTGSLTRVAYASISG